MGPHEPFREEWSVLALDVKREPKEIANRGTAAPHGTAAAGPSRTSGDVDVVVHCNLLVHSNMTTCYEERAITFIKHVGVGVAAVIDVSIWRAQQNDLAIGIVAVIGSFPEFFPQG